MLNVRSYCVDSVTGVRLKCERIRVIPLRAEGKWRCETLDAASRTESPQNMNSAEVSLSKARFFFFLASSPDATRRSCSEEVLMNIIGYNTQIGRASCRERV